MQNQSNIVISVIIITYAHEKYIQEAIEGVFLQQFNGKIELIIANDQSPDSTDEIVKKIIKKAPLKIKTQYTNHEINKGMMPNFVWALQQAKGNYIALCEGDDYWTDPNKLQKQVDFLELNPNIVLCAHSIFMDIKGIICFDVFRKKYKNTYVFNKEEFKNGNPISTVSTMFRNDIPNFSAENILKKDDICGDIPLWLELGNHGDFAILPKRMAVYRDGVGVMSKMKQNELKMFINALYLKHNLILKKQRKPIRFFVLSKLLYCFILNKIGFDFIKHENKK